jgi:hypothetical protein
MLTYIIIRAVVVKGGIAYGSNCNCHLDKVQQVGLQTEEEKVIRKHNSGNETFRFRICTTIFVIIIFAFSRKLLAKIVRKSQKFLERQGRKKIRTNLTILEVYFKKQAKPVSNKCIVQQKDNFRKHILMT